MFPCLHFLLFYPNRWPHLAGIRWSSRCYLDWKPQLCSGW